MGWVQKVAVAAATLIACAVPAGAQTMVAGAAGRVAVQSPDDALAVDAAAVAKRLGLSTPEAARHLRLQRASVAATDALATRFAGRLAGIAIEPAPAFRIVVRLTGEAPKPREWIDVADERVEVAFVGGAPASLTAMVAAITAHAAAMRATLIGAPGLGIDQRTGEVVAVVSPKDVRREGAEPLRARLAAIAGVPLRLRVVDGSTLDLLDGGAGGDGAMGGMRMMGANDGDPRRFLCTAGFVVTDGARTALTTAAHCPDTLRVQDATGREEEMAFAGQWGWGYQDVQVNLSAAPLAPSFYADTRRSMQRAVTGAQPRAGVRAGDVVCHRGERTGYSCSVIELTDFAPAGDLCGGACLPTWTTVAGPHCKGGDSGGPVFLGTTAYGIVKGGSYRPDGSCAFYFYMSTDFVPPGWRLLTAPDTATGPRLRSGAPVQPS